MMEARQMVCTGKHDGLTAEEAADLYLLEEETAVTTAEIFKAMSDPTRVRIIGLLANVEMCVGDICQVLGMSQPAISHHLRTLRALRVAAARRDGKHVYYSLVDEHVRQLYEQGIAHASHE
jgi:ArsR family transcriptional regulator